MKDIISKGASYPMIESDKLSESQATNDLLGAIRQGNNKSASNSKEDKDFVSSNYAKEVQ